MAELDLQAIRERAAKATQGPWHFMCDLQALECAGDDILVTLSDRRPYVADAEFIAHAREDVPTLLAEVERLRKIPEKSAISNELRKAVSNLDESSLFYTLLSQAADRIDSLTLHSIVALEEIDSLKQRAEAAEAGVVERLREAVWDKTLSLTVQIEHATRHEKTRLMCKYEAYKEVWDLLGGDKEEGGSTDETND